jgi:hypothetical protein
VLFRSSPPVAASIRTFRELSDRIGPERVVWRYDPIFLSALTDPGFHLRAYLHIASSLKGYTTRCVVSIVHMYRKIQKRMGELSRKGVQILSCDETVLPPLLRSLAEISSENGIEIRCCADELGLQRYGIQPGKCVDDALIFNAFGFEVGAGKDASQRKSCGGVASKDIGMYDSCLFGCVYCYATASFERARANHRMHDPGSPSLLGWYGKE